MHEATIDSDHSYYETMLEFCKKIITAESEEEIDAVKDNVYQLLNAMGYDDPNIEEFIVRLDRWINMVETEEVSIDELTTKVDNFGKSEEMINICKMCVQAENDIEIGAIKGKCAEDLVAQGYNSEQVEAYLSEVDKNVELLQTVGLHIDQDGLVATGGNVVLPKTEAIQTVSSDVMKPGYTLGIATGIGLSIVIGLLALRKSVLKNKKGKNL